MYSPRFLFVNDTSSSGSTPQDKDHRKRLIHRHVQVQSIVSRRQKADSVHPVSDQSRAGLTSRAREDSKRITTSSGIRMTSRSPPSTHHLSESRVHLRNNISSSPTSRLRMNGQLGNSPLVVDEHVHQYLQYYLSVAHEQLFCSTGLVKSKREDPLLHSAASMIQGCLKSDMLMYALLANMSTMLPEMEPASNLPRSTYYCYQAIRALRHHLLTSAHPDESVLIGLWHLISAENNRGDFEAAQTHLKGANAILRYLQRMGNPPSPQYVALLKACDSLLATGVLIRRLSSTSHEVASA